MKVSRRQFLKTLAAGTFAVATGIGLTDVVKALPEAPNPTTFNTGKFIIDTAEKTIRFVGDGDISVLQLHRWLMDLWDEPHMLEHSIPTARVTDHIIQMENDWKLAPNTYEHLHDGSLKTCEGDIYSNIVTLGDDIVDTQEIEIVQDGGRIVKSISEPQGHISAFVKVMDKGKAIDGGRLSIRMKSKRYDQRSEFVINQAGVGTHYVPVYYKGPFS